MGQLGFFDADRRLAALSEKGDPLEAITALVPWESFRAEIEAVVLTPDEAKKSKAGRKPFDAIMMFRMLVLQSLYNLSDVQIEYQVWDRATFTRFAGADQDRLAELRLQRSPAGDARTQEVSLVQIGEPTGCRLRAEPARRGEKSRRRAANMRRYTNRCNVRSPIFDEIRHESEVSRRSHRESVILRGPL